MKPKGWNKSLVAAGMLMATLCLSLRAEAGVTGALNLNQHDFYTNQELRLDLALANDGDVAVVDAYVALEYAGHFYFYPDFSEAPTGHRIKVQPGTATVTLLKGALEQPVSDFGMTWHMALLTVNDGSVITYTAKTAAARASLPGDMLSVQAGFFVRGVDNPNNDATLTDESPKRKIWMDSFYIGKYEVSNGEFAAFVSGDGYNNPLYWSPEGWAWKEANHVSAPNFWDDPRSAEFHFGPSAGSAPYPVGGLSYFEAEAYAKYKGFRLPTEAEWEKAARGDDERTYPWGNILLCTGVNNEMCGAEGTIPVDSLPEGASPYGALNMAGNVWEWVSDWYFGGYYNTSNSEGDPTPDGNPLGPLTPRQTKVWRGGSWVKAENTIPFRATNRFGLSQGAPDPTPAPGTGPAPTPTPLPESQFGTWPYTRYLWTGMRMAADGVVPGAPATCQ